MRQPYMFTAPWHGSDSAVFVPFLKQLLKNRNSKERNAAREKLRFAPVK